MDMSKVTCFKCGKIGHISTECRSKVTKAEPTKPSGNTIRSDKYAKLKSKYQKLKAHIAQESQKSLVARDEGITESDTSSDEDVFQEAPKSFIAKERCLMAKEAMQKFAKDMTNIQDQNRTSDQSALSASSSAQVSKYATYTHSELIEILSILSNDLLVQNHIHTELKTKLKAFKTESSDHKLTIDNSKLESDILKEANDYKSKYLKTETILVTWCNNAKKAAHACKQQIPRQVQAIIGGDYDAAMAYGEISILEPSYFPENPDDKTIQKINKFLKQQEKKHKVPKGNPTFKQSSLMLEDEKVFMDDVYSGKISGSESVSKAESSKTDSACSSQNNVSVNESKSEPKPIVSKEKRPQKVKQIKVLEKVKPVLASKPSQSETIAKLVESRLNEISKEVNFLKSLSEVKSSQKSQTKANPKLKLKKVVQAKSSVVQAEKPKAKQQWVQKPSKQVTQQILVGELTCDLSSGEPISRWVPKSN